MNGWMDDKIVGSTQYVIREHLPEFEITTKQNVGVHFIFLYAQKDNWFALVIANTFSKHFLLH